MKKNTKTTLWVVGGLAAAMGLFVGIKAIMKRKANKKAEADSAELELKMKAEAELELKKKDTLPPQTETTLTQNQANAIAYKIQKIDKMLKSYRFSKPSDKTKIEKEISSLKQTLFEGGYTYSEGKAVKNVG
jgi:flagellar biosynthesis/type III secretory pathway M-ring protein FliF/YscJ